MIRKTAELASSIHVQAKCRLIQKEDIGIREETACEVHFLPETRRKLGDFAVSARGHSDGFEQFIYALASRFSIHPIKLAEQPQIFAHREQAIAARFSPRNHIDTFADF